MAALMTSKMNRRQFLAGAGSAVAGLLILPTAGTAFGYRANERLNLAVVGMSGYGRITASRRRVAYCR